MAIFIEVHTEGEPSLVNLDQVNTIDSELGGKRCTIYGSSDDNWYVVDETFAEVCEKVKRATSNRKEAVS